MRERLATKSSGLRRPKVLQADWPHATRLGQGRASLKRVVFTPGLVAATLTTRIGPELIHLWRDGVIQPVVERTLLERYIRAMSLLNLSPRLIRRWAWWFTSLEKVVYLSANPFPQEIETAELCARVAEMGSAEWVIHHEGVAVIEPTEVRWVSAEEFVQTGLKRAIPD